MDDGKLENNLQYSQMVYMPSVCSSPQCVPVPSYVQSQSPPLAQHPIVQFNRHAAQFRMQPPQQTPGYYLTSPFNNDAIAHISQYY